MPLIEYVFLVNCFILKMSLKFLAILVLPIALFSVAAVSSTTNCYQIRDADSRYACLSPASGGKSQCQKISSSDLRKKCLAK